MGGDPGYFTPLGGTVSDYYRNAPQLVLTQAESNAQYGVVASRGGSAPRYRVLDGDEAAAQRIPNLGCHGNRPLSQSWPITGAGVHP